MRMYQEFGLTQEAEDWLNKNCQKEGSNPCPHCGKHTAKHLKIIEQYHEEHFYMEGPDYCTYLTHDGKKVKEIMQDEPWSSGPCHFMCLELEDGTRIGEWDQDTIDNC